jgi:hypothetical protein
MEFKPAAEEGAAHRDALSVAGHQGPRLQDSGSAKHTDQIAHAADVAVSQHAPEAKGIEAVRQLFKPSEWQAQAVDLQAEHQTGQHKMLGQLAERFGLGTKYEPVSSKASITSTFAGGLRDTAATIVGPGNVVYSLKQRLYWAMNDKTHKMTQSMVTVLEDGKGGLQKLEGTCLVPFKPHAEPELGSSGCRMALETSLGQFATSRLGTIFARIQ